jgi:chromosomal replication initiation ATPase DnaA
MCAQLTFALPVRAALGRADFLVTPANALAVAALDDVAAWPQGRMLLIGPGGSGKTHLAHVWATDRGAVILLPGAAPGDALPSAAVIEDADRIMGDRAAETALFHLLNRLAAAAVPHLLTARTSPQGWPFALPDLASRLQAAPQARLDAPDDALLAAVLVKLFADRQIAVPPTLIAWLVPRIDRSLSAAAVAVAALDAAALAAGRPVTRALAAEVLDMKGDEGP